MINENIFENFDFDIDNFDDEECNIGATCCTDSCDDPKTCGYTEQGCNGKYGEIHNCKWENSTGVESCKAWLPE